MTPSAPYVSLADFAAHWSPGGDDPEAAFAIPASNAPLPQFAEARVRRHLEELLDTAVALQRGDWLEGGVYVGPHAESEVYADVLAAARTLRVAVPPAILSACGSSAMGAFGTDDRPFLHLSSFFFRGASPGARMFAAGRLCGHVAANQVTWTTLYALLVDHNGLRQVARRNLGPTLEVFLAPLSLGARLVLSRWHRIAEINADRAGLLCCRDLDAAGTSLLRMSLGVRPDTTPEEYLRHSQNQRSEGGPARWTELLATRPWMHKRMQALEVFAKSEVYARLTGIAVPDPLSREELDRQTLSIVRVR